MLAFFFVVFAVPLAIALVTFVVGKGITLKELACIAGACLVVAGASAGIVSCSKTHDTEVLNGRVTNKARNEVSCEHSYPCHCHNVCSGSGKSRSCSEQCDTCYEHPYDVDWDVYTTVGNFTISRVDRQGLREPSRWISVNIGEPVTKKHDYENYVKAAPGSLFRYQGQQQKYAGGLPAYPQHIYDYWHDDRLVAVNVNVSGARAWNDDLQELNAKLGFTKQANVIVVLVKDVPDDWFYALNQAWVGGKKNDVILVASVNNDMVPQWAAVMCWTTNELFKVKLRDDVMALGALTRENVMAVLQQDVGQYYVRKPMHDFKYLKAEITPSMVEWVVTLVISLLVGVGLTAFFQMHDTFGDEGYSYNQSYYY